MNCRQFREDYSDYADGFLDPQREVEARAHLEQCDECRRFDAAFRAGVSALRALPAMGFSRGFAPRLRRQLRREFAVRLPVVAHWSGAVGTLLVIAMVGFVTWDVLGAPHRARFQGHLRSYRTAQALAPSPPAVVPFAGAQGPDTDTGVPEIFHPLQSILLAADTFAGVVAASRPRYDLPVAWGGQ